MPVTLEIAGRAVNRIGDAASTVPVAVRDVTVLASPTVVWSGVTDNNGYFVSALLDDAKEYRAEVTYDPGNAYKVLRDLSSGQMNMLQVRKRFHVRGAATPCVIEGPMTAAAIAATAITGASVNAPIMQRAGQNLWGPDNDGAGTGLDADLLDGQQAAAFAAVGHAHGTAPAHDHTGVYAPTAHDHGGSYAPAAHAHGPVAESCSISFGAYTGNGSGSPRTIATVPGWPMFLVVWEASGAGQGGTWISNGSMTGFGVAVGSDEFVNASGFFTLVSDGRVIINNTAGNPGLGANVNLINYQFMVLYKQPGA